MNETLKRPRQPRRPPKVKISEAQRQTAVINTLRSLGYVVLLIGQKRQPIFCPCGKKHWPITTGNTTGSPDLVISHRRWAAGAMMGLEMKTPDTVRRPEQLALAQAGRTVIVETVGEALRAIVGLERQWEIAPLPAMLAYLEQTSLEQSRQ